MTATATTRWDGAADAFEELGEPWASYGRLLTAEDEARAREQAAAFAMDLDGVKAAAEEREEIQADIVAIRQQMVGTLLRLLAWAVDDNPAALSAIIDPAIRRELDHTQAAVMELEQRVDRIEARP